MILVLNYELYSRIRCLSGHAHASDSVRIVSSQCRAGLRLHWTQRTESAATKIFPGRSRFGPGPAGAGAALGKRAKLA